MDRDYLYHADLKSMKVPELKKYIKTAMPYVSEGLGSEIDPIRKAARLVAKETGTITTKNGTSIKLGFKNATKQDLLSRATKMQRFFDIDVYTKNGIEFKRRQDEKAFNTFRKEFTKSTGVKMNAKEWFDFIEVMDKVRSTINFTRESTEVIAYIKHARKHGVKDPINTVGNVMLGVYKQMIATSEETGVMFTTDDYKNAILNVLKRLGK